MSLKTTNVNCMVDKSDDHHSHYDTFVKGPRMSVQNLMAIHLIVVEMFQCGPKYWTDQQTDRLTQRQNDFAMLLAWLKNGHTNPYEVQLVIL